MQLLTCPYHCTNMSFTGVDAPAAFRAILSKEPDLPTGLAAIKALMEVLRRCSAGTLQELVRLLNGAKEDMKTKVDCSSVSVVSGGELFLRFITLASEALEKEDVSAYFFRLICGTSIIFSSFRISRTCVP